MPGDDAGSGDEVLASLVASLRAELAESRAALAEARQRIAELEARLRQTPRNSSRPPSSEVLQKPPPRSLRKKDGRRPGRACGRDAGAGSAAGPGGAA